MAQGAFDYGFNRKFARQTKSGESKKQGPDGKNCPARNFDA
jgi:hypothetical protein